MRGHMTRGSVRAMSLSAYLKEKGLSQSAVAQAAGVKPAFVSHWVNLRKRVPAERALRLQRELGIPLSVTRPDLERAA